MTNSSIVRGVMSGTNSLPDEDATAWVPKSTPLTSKNPSTVGVRLRAQEAARGKELAAGL